MGSKTTKNRKRQQNAQQKQHLPERIENSNEHQAREKHKSGIPWENWRKKTLFFIFTNDTTEKSSPSSSIRTDVHSNFLFLFEAEPGHAWPHMTQQRIPSSNDDFVAVMCKGKLTSDVNSGTGAHPSSCSCLLEFYLGWSFQRNAFPLACSRHLYRS